MVQGWGQLELIRANRGHCLRCITAAMQAEKKPEQASDPLKSPGPRPTSRLCKCAFAVASMAWAML